MKKNDKVYSTDFVAKKLWNGLKYKWWTILDPSCWAGALLLECAKNISDVNLLFWYDIDLEAVVKCRNNIKLLYPEFNIENIQQRNFIINTFFEEDKRYDNIIMNPPFVRTHCIDKDELSYIRTHYKTCKKWAIDMFVPFIEKAINIWNYISLICPNTILSNKSTDNIIKLLNSKGSSVVDYEHEELFWWVSVRCCMITCWHWGTISRRVLDNKSKVSCSVWIATLADKVFIFSPSKEDEDYYYIWDHKIEKSICRDILKVSKKKIYKIIFPYDSELKILDEELIPHYCYQYLSSKKDILLSRDKWKSEYPWYWFWRTQWLKWATTNIFISWMCKEPDFFISECNLFFSWLNIKTTLSINELNSESFSLHLTKYWKHLWWKRYWLSKSIIESYDPSK